MRIYLILLLSSHPSRTQLTLWIARFSGSYLLGPIVRLDILPSQCRC